MILEQTEVWIIICDVATRTQTMESPAFCRVCKRERKEKDFLREKNEKGNGSTGAAAVQYVQNKSSTCKSPAGPIIGRLHGVFLSPLTGHSVISETEQRTNTLNPLMQTHGVHYNSIKSTRTVALWCNDAFEWGCHRNSAYVLIFVWFVDVRDVRD